MSFVVIDKCGYCAVQLQKKKTFNPVRPSLFCCLLGLGREGGGGGLRGPDAKNQT